MPILQQFFAIQTNLLHYLKKRKKLMKNKLIFSQCLINIFPWKTLFFCIVFCSSHSVASWLDSFFIWKNVFLLLFKRCKRKTCRQKWSTFIWIVVRSCSRWSNYFQHSTGVRLLRLLSHHHEWLIISLIISFFVYYLFCYLIK